MCALETNPVSKVEHLDVVLDRFHHGFPVVLRVPNLPAECLRVVHASPFGSQHYANKGETRRSSSNDNS